MTKKATKQPVTKKTVPAVRVRATLSLSDTEGSQITSLPLGILGSLIRGRTSMTFEAIISEDAQVVTFMDKSRPAWAVVHRGADGGSFWDHNLRAFANFKGSEMPVAKVKRGRGIKVQTKKEDGHTLAEISVDDPTLGPMRQETVFDNREDLAPFGAAFYAVLHCGPVCHKNSGLPYEELAGLGFVIAQKTFLAESKTAFTELQVEVLEVVSAGLADFRPPSGFTSLTEVVKPVDVKGPPTDEIERLADERLAKMIEAALAERGGYDSVDRKPKEDFTPDCLGSTRFGSMAATVHPDLVEHSSSVTNLVAPLLGPTTIAGGTWNIPWLTSLATIFAGSAAAPGSGIFCLLRDPRVPTTGVGGPSGGTGLLDRIAWQSLTERDGNNRTRTQREFIDGTLAATLTAWGISAPTAAALTASEGDMTVLTVDEQIEIVEGFETLELGVVNIENLPTTLGPFSFGSVALEDIESPPLMDVSLTGITGLVDFNGLGGGAMVTSANIGGAGNIVLGLSLPTISLSATITRALTGFGWIVLVVGAVGLCAALPLLCPISVMLAVLVAFVMNNVTAATALCTGVNLGLDIRWRFDNTTERVEPFVTVLTSTGTVALTTTWVTPNVIANIFDSMVSGLGSLFNLWLPVFAEEFRKAMEDGLRRAGLQLPVRGRQLGLRCVAGGATSDVNGLLRLRADVRPIADSALQPYITQVATAERIESELIRDHLDMRRDLNPQATALPGTPDIIDVGTYLGLGLSQNVLNYYLFSQWAEGDFETATGNPAIITDLMALAPRNLFQRIPLRVHMWAATPPRVETMPSEIVAGVRPLLVFFDDVRACFELETPGRPGERPFSGSWELSFNLKALASIAVGFPFAFRIEIDRGVRAIEFSDNRTWEFVDPNVFDVMNQFPQGSLDAFADGLGRLFLRRVSAEILGRPPAPRPWGRRTIAMQQEVLESVPANFFIPEQQVYLELLHRRKVLNVLPAVDSLLLQLIDGSGAPRLNGLLRTLQVLDANATVTAATMDCSQGDALRTTVVPALGLPQFP